MLSGGGCSMCKGPGPHSRSNTRPVQGVQGESNRKEARETCCQSSGSLEEKSNDTSEEVP